MKYALRYAVAGLRKADTAESRIAVDNSEFSTLSTSLSTGVFHKSGGLWIFMG
jgi:hypothetical protein